MARPADPASLPSRRVVITGAGAVSPFGADRAALVAGLASGRSTVSILAAPAAFAAVVADPIGPGPFPEAAWRRLDRVSRMAAIAAAEALRSAGLERGGERIGVVLGTMTAGSVPLQDYLTTVLREGPEAASPMSFPFTVPNAPAGQCSILLRLGGPNVTLARMEASGLAAIALAADLIREGVADACVAGGVDEASTAVLEVWRRVRVAARAAGGPYRGPYDRARCGMAPGQGAYLVCVERLDLALDRGAGPWAEVRGAAQRRAPAAAHGLPVDEEMPARALEGALRCAGAGPGEPAAVVGCGSGSRILDGVDAAAIRRALGGTGRGAPVTAIKGAIGESGAASAAAAIVALMAIREGRLPPVAGLMEIDPRIDLPIVTGQGMTGDFPSVLVGAMATGGSCLGLLLTRVGS